jgi:hypothetical protein
MWEALGYRWGPMDVKPDPKPGRWILPLVVVAMVGFTYIFVSSIDLTGGPDAGNGNGGVDIGGPTTTTMPVIDTTVPPDEDPDLDPDVQAYVDLINGFDVVLQRITDDFVAANAAWDAGTATYTATGDQFRSLISELETWSGSVASSNAPPGNADLVAPHQTIKDAASAPLTAARAALAGLQSNAPGSADDRRAAVADLESAAATFSNAVTAAVSAAGG